MSPSFACDLETMARFPRVSGDEPTDTPFAFEVMRFSPREWG